jgi:hypothetical protein
MEAGICRLVSGLGFGLRPWGFGFRPSAFGLRTVAFTL